MLQKKKKANTKAKFVKGIKCEVCEGIFNLEDIDAEKSILKRMNICKNCSNSED